MYDARPNRLFGDGNLLFGITTIVVVGGCFAGALMIPGIGGSQDETVQAQAESPLNANLADPETLNQAMASPDEQRFLKALLAVAPNRYVTLQRAFADEALDETARMTVVQETAFETLAENADLLTFASGQSLNHLLDGAVRDLNTAAQSKSKYCMASTYEDLADAPEAAVTRWATEQDFSDADFYPTAMRMNADMLELIRQARTNPARHGLFTQNDEAELQRVLIGVMADPAMVRIMTAGANQSDALSALNLCAIGAKAFSALRSLPDDTKGRAWAAFLANPEVKQAIRSAQQQAST